MGSTWNRPTSLRRSSLHSDRGPNCDNNIASGPGPIAQHLHDDRHRAPSAPNTRAAADTRELSGIILLACRTVGGGGVCACVIGPQFAFCAGRRTNVSAIRWDGAARGGVRVVWGRGCYVRYVCLCAYELTVVLLGAHAVC